MADRVEVAIPVFEPRRVHLRALLRSVADQSYSVTRLLISVDGFSGARDVARWCENVATETGLDVVITRQASRLGMVANWNAAVALGDAPIVLCSGQDDLLCPHALATHLDRLRSASPGLSCGHRTYVDADGAAVRSPRRGRAHVGLLRAGHPVLDAALVTRLALMYGNVFGEPCSFAFRRELFERIGGFDPSFPHAADLAFLLEAAHVGGGLGYSPGTTAARRLHAGNASRAQIRAGVANDDRLRLYERYHEHLVGSRERDRARAMLLTHAAYDAVRARRPGPLAALRRSAPGRPTAVGLLRAAAEDCGLVREVTGLRV